MWKLEKDEGIENPDQTKIDLDTILVNEIGPFGRYQIRTIILTAIPMIFSSLHSEYIFTTARIKSRCLIPECENATTVDFSTSLVQNAFPADGASFNKCHRYGKTTLPGNTNNICSSEIFNTSILEECETSVYENKLTVVYDFDLGCNEWRRAIIGTSRPIGALLAFPFIGYISDRWGRRTALVISSFNGAWIGLIRYWITSYSGFVIAGIIETFFLGGIFSTIYILVLELVGPKYRVIAGGMVSAISGIGVMLLGLIAWAVPDWKNLTLILYIPQLVTIVYLWCIAESVRWYISKGRFEESEAVLKEVARINNKQLSEKTLDMLKSIAEKEKIRKALEDQQKSQEPWLIWIVFNHKQILIRCLVLPLWWISGIMVFYGLSVNSVIISGNQYVNYIAVGAVEIPGFLLGALLLEKIGRKPVLMGGFWASAACQFGYIFTPSDMYGLSLLLYVATKFAISIVITAIYIYTAEVFPTKYRHNLLAFSAMVGRFGAIIAHMTPAFGAITFEKMPFVLFGSFALVSSCLVPFMPETLGSKLPDTIEEAEQLGVKKNISKS